MSEISTRPADGRRFVIFGLFVATGLIASAVLWAMAERNMGPWTADKPEPDRNPVVEFASADVAYAALVSLNRSLPLTGSLSPLVQTTVKAQAPGEVTEVTVREGQSVQQGEVLVRIDPRNLSAELDNQQAVLEKARADLALARLDRDKSASLLEKRFIAQNAYDAVDAAYKASRANVKAAEAQLSLARIALDYATVRAPFAGTVAQRLVQPGEKVGIGSSMLMLVDLSHLELEAPVPANDVSSIKTGQIASFHVGGFDGRAFEAKVERINPMIDTGSRTVMLYLSVDNADGVLKGGMFAQGDLLLEQTAPVIAVPLTAVREQAGRSFVFVIENDTIARRPVKPGMRSEAQNLVEIREGIAAGERVVTARIATLKADSPVLIAVPAANTVAADDR